MAARSRLSRAEIDEANAGSLAQAEYFMPGSSCAGASRAMDLTSQSVQAEEKAPSSPTRS